MSDFEAEGIVSERVLTVELGHGEAPDVVIVKTWARKPGDFRAEPLPDVRYVKEGASSKEGDGVNG